MTGTMISQADAQDLVNAISAQRDAHANSEAQLYAEVAKLRRKVAELETQVSVMTQAVLAPKPNGSNEASCLGSGGAA